MSEEMECMCLQCGISTYRSLDEVSLEDPASMEGRVLSDVYACAACGGRLILVGRAGNEPRYRLK
jgi:hypothetical protein